MIETGILKAQAGTLPGEDPVREGLLKVGDRMTVQVLKLEGSQALVAFGRFRAPALVDFTVRAGDRIRVQVAGMQGGRLRLHLADGFATTVARGAGPAGQTGALLPAGGVAGGDAAGIPLTLPAASDLAVLQEEIARLLLSARGAWAVRGGADDVPAMLARIAQNMGPLPLEEGGAELAPRIESRIDDYGVFFEKKLEALIVGLLRSRAAGPLWRRPEIRALMERDMKPGLLRLQRAFGELEKRLSDPVQGRTAGVRHLLEGLLADIEQQQDRAVHLRSVARSLQESVYTAGLQKPVDAAGPDTPQAFTYQFNLPDQDSRLRLKVYYAPSRKKQGGQGNRLSLLLSMGALGDLRTDFFLLHQNLEITFFVADEGVRKRIEEHLPLLKPAVEPLFAGLHVRVLVSVPKIKTFETQDRTRPDDRLVDYRV